VWRGHSRPRGTLAEIPPSSNMFREPFGRTGMSESHSICCNIIPLMVRDGYYYGGVMLGAAFLVGWLTTPLWAVIPILLGAFFMWFFRDPERIIPSDPAAVVSPADGKVTEVADVRLEGQLWKRISIFLNVFNVHVNRAPVSGTIRAVRYQEGKFLNAMDRACAECNEQNTVTVEGEGYRVIFKQIAGLLARRIGLIKFGSRTDVFLSPDAEISVRVGDHVKGGSTILAFLKTEPHELAGVAS